MLTFESSPPSLTLTKKFNSLLNCPQMVLTVGKPGPHREKASNALLRNINGHVKMIRKLKKISNMKEKREKKSKFKKRRKREREENKPIENRENSSLEEIMKNTKQMILCK